jgi:hypothetical protein
MANDPQAAAQKEAARRSAIARAERRAVLGAGMAASARRPAKPEPLGKQLATIALVIGLLAATLAAAFIYGK